MMNGIPRWRTLTVGGLLLCAAFAAQAADETRAAIEAADVQFGAAVQSGDSKALAALYTADAQVMPEGSDPIKGTAAIQKFFQKDLIDAGVGGATLKTLEVFGGGKTAAEVGEYELRDKSGKPIDHGKYIVVWRKVNGVWKLHRDMFSTNVPPKK